MEPPTGTFIHIQDYSTCIRRTECISTKEHDDSSGLSMSDGPLPCNLRTLGERIVDSS